MKIRQVTTADAKNVAQVMYEAFGRIADRHNFPRDFPSLESAVGMAEMATNNPYVRGFVAENSDGQFLGSNFLWTHNRFAGVGPITVDPGAQASGVGRALMQAVIDAGQEAAGIRLVQDAFNTTSLSLYASLGFKVVEPLVLVQGIPQGEPSQETRVRPLTENDIAECAELCKQIHGFDRSREIEQFSQALPGLVAERDNRIVAYATAPPVWQMNHAVAVSNEELQDLLLGAGRLTGEQPLAFLLPIRQAELFRWCLSRGLKVVKPMNLMVTGDYQEPHGCYLPSVIY
jgi:predicted N-acetyltransferase YhbS